MHLPIQFSGGYKVLGGLRGLENTLDGIREHLKPTGIAVEGHIMPYTDMAEPFAIGIETQYGGRGAGRLRPVLEQRSTGSNAGILYVATGREAEKLRQIKAAQTTRWGRFWNPSPDTFCRSGFRYSQVYPIWGFAMSPDVVDFETGRTGR